MEITNEQSKDVITHISGLGNKAKIDLLPFCSKYTLNSICGNLTLLSGFE